MDAQLGKCQAPLSLYRFGWAAWVWRVLIGGALAGGVLLAWVAWRERSWVPLAVALPLLVPALFFGFVVATEVVRIGDGEIRVRTLLFWPRRLAVEWLGRPRVRTRVEETWGAVHAPRAWVPVRRGLPVYLDLLATIPDARAFQKVFGISPKAR